VQALNDYSGAVILISHDRHMVELTADRLVLVDDGTAKEYSGSMTDYIDFVLGVNQPKKDRPAKSNGKGKGVSAKGPSAKDRARAKYVQAEIRRVEKIMAKLQSACSEIDEAMFEPGKSGSKYANKSMSELLSERAVLSDKTDLAEAEWLKLSEQLEAVNPS